MEWREQDIPDQSGRLAVITGANSGIGYETARALASRGARVVLACRSAEKGRKAEAGLRAAVPGAEIRYRELDRQLELALCAQASHVVVKKKRTQN